MYIYTIKMSNWLKDISAKLTNEFTNPDSDLLSGRFLAKITKQEKPPSAEKQEQAKESEKKEPVILKPIVCYRCGRRGHKSPYCHAKTHIDGYEI